MNTNSGAAGCCSQLKIAHTDMSIVGSSINHVQGSASVPSRAQHASHPHQPPSKRPQPHQPQSQAAQQAAGALRPGKPCTGATVRHSPVGKPPPWPDPSRASSTASLPLACTLPAVPARDADHSTSSRAVDLTLSGAAQEACAAPPERQSMHDRSLSDHGPGDGRPAAQPQRKAVTPEGCQATAADGQQDIRLLLRCVAGAAAQPVQRCRPCSSSGLLIGGWACGQRPWCLLRLPGDNKQGPGCTVLCQVYFRSRGAPL